MKNNNKVLLYNVVLLILALISIFVFNLSTKGTLMVSFMLFVSMNVRFLALNLKTKLHRAMSVIQELSKEMKKTNNHQMDLNSLLLGTFLVDTEFYKTYNKSVFNTLWVWQHQNPSAPMIMSLLNQSEKTELVSTYVLSEQDQQIIQKVLAQIKNLNHIEIATLVLEKFPKLQEYQDNQRIIFSKLVA